MNNLFFLVYGIIFLLISGYLMLSKKFLYAILCLAIGIVLILLYKFLKIEEETNTAVTETSSSIKKETPHNKQEKLVIKETLQSPILRNTFNYVNDTQNDGSTGKITYGGDSNITRWGIGITDFTHIKFPNGMVFKLRKQNSTDSYGYFVDSNNKKITNIPDNFFSDFIQLGTFS